MYPQALGLHLHALINSKRFVPEDPIIFAFTCVYK